jgi:hypothetical protein
MPLVFVAPIAVAAAAVGGVLGVPAAVLSVAEHATESVCTLFSLPRQTII